MNYSHYSDLAELFDFPGPEYIARGKKLLGFLRKNYPDAASELELFLDVIPDNANDLQELHTRTFDVQSLTTLGIGYVMFGDDYKRGDLLANLNREHLLVNNDCMSELSDHLPNVLRLITLTKDQDFREELVGDLLVPALTLIIHEFDPNRVVKKEENYQKHYKTLIEAAGRDKLIFGRAFKTVLLVMTKDFQQVPEILARLSDVAKKFVASDFLGMIEKEMEVEQFANPQNSGGDH